MHAYSHTAAPSPSRGSTTANTPLSRTKAANAESPAFHHLRDSEGYIAVPHSLMSSAVVDDRYKPSTTGFNPPKDGEFDRKFFEGLTIERSLTEQENALLAVCKRPLSCF